MCMFFSFKFYTVRHLYYSISFTSTLITSFMFFFKVLCESNLIVCSGTKMKVNYCMQTSSAKQLKDLRSSCLKIISSVIDNYEDHDFGSEFWDLFFKSVKSLMDAFKNEGSSSEKPSSLFSCFLSMSRSSKLVPLLYRERNLIPDIFSILTVTTASQAILSSVLKFIENLLTHEDDGDIERVLVLNLEALLCSLHCCFQTASKRYSLVLLAV